MKKMYYAVVLVVTATLALTLMAFVGRDPLPAGDHTEIVLRQIGHRLLWHAGDSSSRVLPVQRRGDHVYQLRFEQPFSFVSDSLMHIVKREMKKGDMPEHYIVEVKDCSKQDLVMGFEMDPAKGNTLACEGREIRVDCYLINIRFIPSGQQHLLWLLPLGLTFFTGAFMMMNRDKETPVLNGHRNFGAFSLDVQQRLLHVGDHTYTLTDNETQALDLFTRKLNDTVAREELMKTIWEDKGLIVIDRNVDVLVSKLRKKLSPDPRVKINNVHGRGYKMIIEA